MVKHVFDAGGPANPPNWDPEKYSYSLFVKKHNIKSINILFRIFLKLIYKYQVDFGPRQTNETYHEFVGLIEDNMVFCKKQNAKYRMFFNDKKSAIFMFKDKKDALLFRLRINRNNGYTKSSF